MQTSLSPNSTLKPQVRDPKDTFSAFTVLKDTFFAERGAPASLLHVATWNERAAVRAKRQGDTKAAERHKRQAKQLRKEARQ